MSRCVAKSCWLSFFAPRFAWVAWDVKVHVYCNELKRLHFGVLGVGARLSSRARHTRWVSKGSFLPHLCSDMKEWQRRTRLKSYRARDSEALLGLSNSLREHRAEWCDAVCARPRALSWEEEPMITFSQIYRLWCMCRYCGFRRVLTPQLNVIHYGSTLERYY